MVILSFACVVFTSFQWYKCRGINRLDMERAFHYFLHGESVLFTRLDGRRSPYLIGSIDGYFGTALALVGVSVGSKPVNMSRDWDRRK